MKMKLAERLCSPTPPFFRKLRNIGLALAAVSTAIVGAPVDLPSAVLQIAGYLFIAGTVAGAVSQSVMKDEK
jgi:hypothetical protein